MIRAATILSVSVAVVLLAAACSPKCSSAPDESELPVILCEPLPPGSAGCIGIPGDAVGPDAKVYPFGCTVKVAEVHEVCGYRAYYCSGQKGANGEVLGIRGWLYPK